MIQVIVRIYTNYIIISNNIHSDETALFYKKMFTTNNLLNVDYI